MTAALAAAKKGLSVVLVEKAPHYGGSTARSGGGLWVPNNHVLARAGIEDTTDDATAYLDHIVGSTAPASPRSGSIAATACSNSLLSPSSWPRSRTRCVPPATRV